MLWIYGHYKYFNSLSAGILTSKDGTRTERVNPLNAFAAFNDNMAYFK